MNIGQVVERTGLTQRTLRFYEERGLVNPSRTETGRRVYGSADLATLHRVIVLKQAGFSLSAIKQLLREPSLDGREIIAAQIAALEQERTEIDDALARLRSARTAISTGTPLDAELLCDLIRTGGRTMNTETWKDYFEKHCSPEEKQKWMSAKLKAAAGDWDSYASKWQDLSNKIAKALPLDPASDRAQDLLAKWSELLTPFAHSLDGDMKSAAQSLAARTTEGLLEPPVSQDVWDFIEAARRATHESNI